MGDYAWYWIATADGLFGDLMTTNGVDWVDEGARRGSPTPVSASPQDGDRLISELAFQSLGRFTFPRCTGRILRYCSYGTCVIQCLSGQTLCGTDCVTLSSSKGNCGFCGAACPGNLSCVNSQCMCSSPFTNCGGTCTYLPTDRLNCGSCGTRCVAPTTCVAGKCQ
jgi:hypothetical protein